MTEGGAQAPVTRALLVAIGLMFVAETLLGGSTSRQVLVTLGANVPRLVQGGEIWRLATSMFLHIGVLHLLFNGWALFQLGTLYETWVGSGRFTLVYFVSGLVGSTASVLVMPNPESLSAGASGAIFGLLGALIAFLFRRRNKLLPPARSLLTQLVGWAGINIFLGFTIPEIDNAAHLGGCAAGILLGWGIAPRWERREPREPSWEE